MNASQLKRLAEMIQDYRVEVYDDVVHLIVREQGTAPTYRVSPTAPIDRTVMSVVFNPYEDDTQLLDAAEFFKLRTYPLLDEDGSVESWASCIAGNNQSYYGKTLREAILNCLEEIVENE